jgi:hypothetical protein
VVKATAAAAVMERAMEVAGEGTAGPSKPR